MSNGATSLWSIDRPFHEGLHDMIALSLDYFTSLPARLLDTISRWDENAEVSAFGFQHSPMQG